MLALEQYDVKSYEELSTLLQYVPMRTERICSQFSI